MYKFILTVIIISLSNSMFSQNAVAKYQKSVKEIDVIVKTWEELPNNLKNKKQSISLVKRASRLAKKLKPPYKDGTINTSKILISHFQNPQYSNESEVRKYYEIAIPSALSSRKESFLHEAFKYLTNYYSVKDPILSNTYKQRLKILDDKIRAESQQKKLLSERDRINRNFNRNRKSQEQIIKENTVLETELESSTRLVNEKEGELDSLTQEFSIVQEAQVEKQTLLVQWLGTSLAFLLLTLLIFIVYRTRTKNKLNQEILERFKLENSLNHTQLLAVRNSLDIHFHKNMLDIIEFALEDGNLEEANIYFSNYHKLLDYGLSTLKQANVKLSDEIKFLDSYLQLQRLIRGDWLNYEIKIDPGIDLHIRIPSMVLEVYVENAVLHGLLPKHSMDPGFKGIVNISILQNEANLICRIEDNGVGLDYSQSKGKRNSTGLGMKLARDIVENYSNNVSRSKEAFHLQVKNKNSHGEMGTLIEIQFPISYQSLVNII